MRSLFYVFTACAVIALAFWAYHENYKTQTVQAEAERVQRQISQARARLRVLNAEWAYLNRPDRLRDLAEINFEKLGLLPLQPDQFGNVDQVSFPRNDEDETIFSITNGIEVSNPLVSTETWP
ncbi:cell division protein FtsL [Roseovarius sp. EL26]|uniref:cell division protein FtsL n=1 Tax=Roseovarius sp. EL26 TaxID=2126672 RepID=UPI00157626C3|nr:cell division protein FtsL [Roseovarius sp. EL26]